MYKNNKIDVYHYKDTFIVHEQQSIHQVRDSEHLGDLIPSLVVCTEVKLFFVPVVYYVHDLYI